MNLEEICPRYYYKAYRCLQKIKIEGFKSSGRIEAKFQQYYTCDNMHIEFSWYDKQITNKLQFINLFIDLNEITKTLKIKT